jgi:hypothetical protein
MIASSSNSVEVRSYYESRFAELLELFESHERKSIASSEHVNARQ